MESCFDLALHRWASQCRISPMLAMMAQDIALIAPGAYALMIGVRNGEVDSALPPQPSTHDWLALYRQHRRVTAAGSVLMQDYPMFHGKDLVGMIDEARRESRKAKENPGAYAENLRRTVGERDLRRQFLEGIKEAQATYREHLRKLHKRVMMIEDEPDDLDRLMREKPELYFHARVALPCMFVFGETPQRLLRKARLGDPTAIENLVRVDPMVIHEPRIADWLHGGIGAARLERKRSMGQWIEQGINGRITPSTVTQTLAGVVSLLSEIVSFRIEPPSKLIPTRLTAAQVRGLFDAATTDRMRPRAKNWGLNFNRFKGMSNAASEWMTCGTGTIYGWSWVKAIQRAREKLEPLFPQGAGQIPTGLLSRG